MKMRLWGRVVILGLGIALVCGCGGSDEPPVPDSGYGEKQAVPAISCDALCAREGDCAEHLCNEDTNSTRYTGLGSLIAGLCNAQCSESLLASRVNAQTWSCMFESSCRAAVADDVCHIQASYQCQ